MMRVNHVQFLLDQMNERELRHSNNVACLCYAFGQAINCPPDELEALWFAGLLLDAGKIWLDGRINNKIDISFEEEYDIRTDEERLANYTLYTQAVLNSLSSGDGESDIDFSLPAVIIEQGEENVDGSGYPRHLLAEDIDTLSKVLRIAAFYDNCRLDGMSHDAACKTIRKQSDKIFPHKIITPFIKSVVSNEMHRDYCEARNWTIGQLTAEEELNK